MKIKQAQLVDLPLNPYGIRSFILGHMPSKSPKKGTEEFGKKPSVATNEAILPALRLLGEAHMGMALMSTNPNPAPCWLCG